MEKTKTIAMILTLICLVCLFIRLTYVSGFTYLSSSTTCYLVVPMTNDAISSTKRFELTADELHIVRSALNFRPIYVDRPSCGFSEKCSLQFFNGNEVKVIIYPPFDRCPNFLVGDFGYVSTDQNDAQRIREIVEKYRKAVLN